jgi:hypothetical protein
MLQDESFKERTVEVHEPRARKARINEILSV